MLDYWNANELFVTFDSVTNIGGIPKFFTENCSLDEVAQECNADWHALSEEDQEEDVELLGCYMRTYDEFFNLNK